MNSAIEYETPENVMLSYQIAGPGSRFMAWVLDMILMTIGMILFFIAMILFAALMDSVWVEGIGDYVDRMLIEEESIPQAMSVIGGFAILIWGLGSFVYFSMSELFLRGQTIGKRASQIRVVKLNGFALDPTSILVRNIFRIVDQTPMLWIVPLVNQKRQRFGDMVGGTLVIAEQEAKIHPLRSAILDIDDSEIQFRFPASTLNKLSVEQISAIEQICERWSSLDEQLRQKLLDKVLPALSQKLNIDMPGQSKQYQFLTDLLYAEYRRQERRLG